MSKKTKPDHLKHLRQSTREWYDSTVEDWELAPHHLRVLQLAAESWDRCQEAREILAKDGLCVTNRFGERKQHPMVAVERDARTAFCRCIRELGLDLIDSPVDPRLPRLGGGQ